MLVHHEIFLSWINDNVGYVHACIFAICYVAANCKPIFLRFIDLLFLGIDLSKINCR